MRARPLHTLCRTGSRGKSKWKRSEARTENSASHPRHRGAQEPSCPLTCQRRPLPGPRGKPWGPPPETPRRARRGTQGLGLSTPAVGPRSAPCELCSSNELLHRPQPQFPCLCNGNDDTHPRALSGLNEGVSKCREAVAHGVQWDGDGDGQPPTAPPARTPELG